MVCEEREERRGRKSAAEREREGEFRVTANDDAATWKRGCFLVLSKQSSTLCAETMPAVSSFEHETERNGTCCSVRQRRHGKLDFLERLVLPPGTVAPLRSGCVSRVREARHTTRSKPAPTPRKQPCNAIRERDMRDGGDRSTVHRLI